MRKVSLSYEMLGCTTFNTFTSFKPFSWIRFCRVP